MFVVVVVAVAVDDVVAVVVLQLQFEDGRTLQLQEQQQGLPAPWRAGKHIPLNPPTFHAESAVLMSEKCMIRSQPARCVGNYSHYHSIKINRKKKPYL